MGPFKEQTVRGSMGAAAVIFLIALRVAAESENQLDERTEEGAVLEDVPVLMFVFGSCVYLVLWPWFKKRHLSRLKLDDLAQWGPLAFFSHVRTFDNFTRTVEEQEFPPMPATTLQVSYVSSRKSLYLERMKDTVFTNQFRFIYAVGVFAVVISWWIRFAPVVYAKATYSFFHPNVVMANMGAAADVHSVLLPLASFSIALYINQRLAWFYTVMNLTWAIQGRLHDIAMIIGGNMCHHDDPEVCEVLWLLYRHLNLLHWYTYVGVSTRCAAIDEAEVLKSGLATEDELRELAIAVNKKNQVTTWVCHTIMVLLDTSLVPPQYAQSLMGTLKALRGATSTLTKEVKRIPPVSFAQLIQLMIDGATILTPPALAFTFKSDRDGLSVYMWPALGSMIIGMFYQGGLQFISMLADPFGGHADNLDPDWSLMASERKIFGYLTASVDVIPALEHFGIEDLSRVLQEEADTYAQSHPHEFYPGSPMRHHLAVNTPRTLHHHHHQVHLGGGGTQKDPNQFSMPQQGSKESSKQSNQYSKQSQDQYSEYSESYYSNSASYSMMSSQQYSSAPRRNSHQSHVSQSSQQPQQQASATRGANFVPPVAIGQLSEATFKRIEDLVERYTGELEKLILNPFNNPMPQNVGPWGSNQRVVMDLVARYHEESRNTAHLKQQLAKAPKTKGASKERMLVDM